MDHHYEQLVNQHALETESRAAEQRLARRVHAARRWQRLAAWSAHRSAMADQALRNGPTTDSTGHGDLPGLTRR